MNQKIYEIFGLSENEARDHRLNYIIERMDAIRAILGAMPKKRSEQFKETRRRMDDIRAIRSRQIKNLTIPHLKPYEIEFLRQEIGDLTQKLSRLGKRMSFLSPHRTDARNKFDLGSIKENRPIVDFMPTRPVYRMEGRSKYLCPFHNEKTGSFVVFEKDNSFHCFGCSAHGDVIDLVMRLYGDTFVEACKRLS